MPRKRNPNGPGRGKWGLQAFCKRGHPLSGDNVHVRMLDTGKLHRRCRACNRVRWAEWRKTNPVKERTKMPREMRLQKDRIHNERSKLRKYGLSPAVYEQMLEMQLGGCAICGGKCPTGKLLSVDHDHKSGINRGLLCANCNNGLGRFKDDTRLLKAAIDYLTTNVPVGDGTKWWEIARTAVQT